MEKIFKMKFYKVYDALLNKLLKKNKTKYELDSSIFWLLGYELFEIEKAYQNKELTYEEFFNKAPKINSNRNLITGKICGLDIQSIENQTLKNMRILDKLIDEFSKGKNKENILIENNSLILDYISNQEEPLQPYLKRTYEIIKSVLIGSVEKISWSMPTFYQESNIIHFAANKYHIGIYPGTEVVEDFKDRLVDFKTSKGAIRIPYIDPLPEKLIEDLASWSRNSLNKKRYQFDAKIESVETGGAYIKFPWDLKEEFGKGRQKVHALFNGQPYSGSVVDMGVRDEDGSICYIIGIRKDIQKSINKYAGDIIHVVIVER